MLVYQREFLDERCFVRIHGIIFFDSRWKWRGADEFRSGLKVRMLRASSSSRRHELLPCQLDGFGFL